MPTPEPGESEKDFVSRCIPIVIKDGTAKDDQQAAAVCYSLFRGKKEVKDLDAQLEELNGMAEKDIDTFGQPGVTFSPEMRAEIMQASAEANKQAAQPVAQFHDEPGLFAQLVNFLTGWVHKEGKRNSSSDAERLQKAHDLLVENGAQCTLKVYKGADGKLRWVTFSSTAFQDRDKEIVSEKALSDDVDYADRVNEYGPLRWWHVNGLDLGDCDYNAMSGKVLIESGTFRDEAVGTSIKEAADDLAVSIGFQHPPSEPDAAGVFHTIRRFERSLLPADKASNLFTQLSVSKEQTDMTLLKEKFDKLVELIGEKPAKALAEKAEATEKAALAAGVAFKETPAPETPAAPETAKAAEPDGDEGYGKMVEKCMKGLEALGARMDAHEKSHKEAHEAEAAEVAKATKERDDKVELLAAAVAELMGETPRAAKGFRPTQEASTIRQGVEPEGPQTNKEFDKFLNFMATGETPK